MKEIMSKSQLTSAKDGMAGRTTLLNNTIHKANKNVESDQAFPFPNKNKFVRSYVKLLSSTPSVW